MSDYNHAIFDVDSVETAKNIILTPENGRTTAQRWASETVWTADKIIDLCHVRGGDTLLDYGCGIGRVAKAILDKIDVIIIGVDISSAMLRHSFSYVGHSGFCPLSRDAFVDLAGAHKIKVDHAYAIYVLQHVEHPSVDIDAIGRAARNSLFLINNRNRVVPMRDAKDSRTPWIDDAFDVPGELQKVFPIREAFRLDYEKITELPVGLISAVFRK